MTLSPESLIVGMLGIIVLFLVLARLSARMGEGMHLARYYYLYYLSILLVILAAFLYFQPLDGILALGLLIGSNCLAILASYKYWWWLKDELVG